VQQTITNHGKRQVIEVLGQVWAMGWMLEQLKFLALYPSR